MTEGVSFIILTLILGLCSGENERGDRFVVNENGVGQMDLETEIVMLKQHMTQQTIDMARQTLELTRQTAELARQSTEIDNLRQQIESLEMNKGTTYIRWGKSACSGNGTATVYSGYMAGTDVENSNAGSGANYLCLPDHPTWGHYTEGVQNSILITGAEYDLFPHQNSDIVDYFGENIYGAQAPCAVCHIERSASIMIPGRTQCYGGWTEEYVGYLVTGYPLFHDSTEFVCLDKRPEMVTNTGTFNGKNRLFLVEPICGFDLECPPYVSGRELSCVVCSK